MKKINMGKFKLEILMMKMMNLKKNNMKLISISQNKKPFKVMMRTTILIKYINILNQLINNHPELSKLPNLNNKALVTRVF